MLPQPKTHEDKNKRMLWQDCIYFYLKPISSTPQEEARRKVVVKNLKANGLEFEDLKVYVGRFIKFTKDDDFLLMGLDMYLKELVRTAVGLEVTDEEWFKSLGVSYHYNLNNRNEGAFIWRGNDFAIGLIESFRQWATGNCNTMPCSWCHAPMLAPKAGTKLKDINYCTPTCASAVSADKRKRREQEHKNKNERAEEKARAQKSPS